jgi:molecular chaperone DnaK
MAADNRSLAQFELTGIPPSARGIPKIQVTFSINAEGLLSVEAVDLGTNRSQTVEVTPASGLSQEQVEHLVTQGETFKEADQLRRNLAELRNQAETLIYTTEEAINAYGDLLDEERAAQVQADVEELRAMLKSGADLESLRDAHAQLENAAFEIAEAMYGGDEDESVLAPDT